LPSDLLRNSRLNAVSSYAYFIIGAVVTFFISPYLVMFLGASAFGILKSVQKWLDFATVADGRPSQALKWVIANKQSTASDSEKRQYVGCSIKVSAFFLPILICIVALLVYLLPELINGLAVEQHRLVSIMGIILGANIILGPLLAIPDSVLAGVNQAYRATVIRIFWLVLSNVFMFYFAYLGYSLIIIALTIVVSAILNAACVYIITNKYVSWMGVEKSTKKQFNDFLGFSGWVLSWTFVSKILLSSELLLLGYLISAEQVSNYVFSTYITQLGLALALMTGSAFMPIMGRLIGANDIERLTPLIDGFREILLLIVVVIGGGVLALNASFVNLWVGNEYFLGSTVNGLVVLAFVQLVLLRGEAQIQDLSLNIKNKVLIGLLSSVLSVVLAVVFYKIFNDVIYLFVGIITGRLLMTFVFPFMVNRVNNTQGYPIGKVFVSLAILVFCYFLGMNITLNSWFDFLWVSLFTGLILAVVTFKLLLSDNSITMLKR
jgi:O-antigen/teichoic acid export membrane protein